MTEIKLTSIKTCRSGGDMVVEGRRVGENWRD